MRRVISTGKWVFTLLPESVSLIAIHGGKTEKCVADIPPGGWAHSVLIFDVTATTEVWVVTINWWQRLNVEIEEEMTYL